MSVVNIPEENSSSLLTNSTLVTRQHLITQNPNPSLPKNTDNISHHLSPAYYNFNSHHTTNLLSLNPHLANVGDDVKSTTRSSEFIDQRPGLGISSRWSPTPEQLIALEEMYRRGTRTPSAEQIQHIASQLRRFGKIEGKNVFYWFQNHKARERQKRRRREMETYDNNLSDQEKHHNNNNNNTHHSVPAEKKESGLRKTSYDIGQTRKWGPSSNSEQQEQQHRVSDISSSSSTTCSGPQSYCNGWSQFDQRECQVQQIRKLTTTKVMNAAWQEMECLPSPLECNTKFLKIDPRHHHHHHQNYLSGFSFLNMKPNNYQQQENGEETQTLELFPLHDNNIKDDDDGDGNSDVNGTKKVPITAINDTNNYSPSSFQYIEFLPLKKTEAQN